MIEADQAFRDMCEELAEAESALSRVDRLPEPMRLARTAEWQDLVGRLVREIEAALHEKQAVTQSRLGADRPCETEPHDGKRSIRLAFFISRS
jgi:hypothetical protein